MGLLGNECSKIKTYKINELVEFSTEITGVPLLAAPKGGKFSISAPADVSEQRTIAIILSNIGIDIYVLKRHLTETRQFKQAKM